MFGENTLGMELDAPNREINVLESHDLPFFGFRCNFKAIRNRRRVNDKGVVTRCHEWIWQPFEQVFAVMLHGRGFAVHHPIIDFDRRVKRMSYALVSEANSENWNVS